MKKALMMSSVASMIDLFNMDNIQILRNMGYKVDVATNFKEGSITDQSRVDEFREGITKDAIESYHIPVPRSIFKVGDIKKSYRILKDIIESNEYDIVHCHSPIGGVIARAASKSSRKQGTKVIYTAHGFHFFKGSPITKWIIYYSVEKLASFYTDVLITINKEDFSISKKLHAKKNVYVPGIGIDVEGIRETKIDRVSKRSSLGIMEDDFMFFSAGQLSKRKNHEVAIRALAQVENPKVKLVISGLGELEIYLQDLISHLKLQDRVILTGYRNDIIELMKASDGFIFPSFQEGLPVALMEAMAAGLPVVCSSIRGNVDLIEDNVNGYLIEAIDDKAFSVAMQKISSQNEIRTMFEKNNLIASEKYDRGIIIEQMLAIYKSTV